MSSFAEFNHMFSEPWDFSDAILVVEGEKFHVHRAILSMCSPVFKTMFQSGFKESSQTEIPLPCKKADKIHELLCAIYPFPSQISENCDIKSLLQLAREYQIHKLTTRCEERLLQKQSSVELVLLAQEFSLKKLLEKCLNSLSRLQLQELENMVLLLSNHSRWLKEQHAREIRILREQHNKEKARALEIVDALNSCWGYDKLPIRGCTCASYTRSCDNCNTILEKFIKMKCGELFEALQSSNS